MKIIYYIVMWCAILFFLWATLKINNPKESETKEYFDVVSILNPKIQRWYKDGIVYKEEYVYTAKDGSISTTTIESAKEILK